MQLALIAGQCNRYFLPGLCHAWICGRANAKLSLSAGCISWRISISGDPRCFECSEQQRHLSAGWAILLAGWAAIRTVDFPKALASLLLLAGGLSVCAFLIPIFSLIAPLLYVIWSVWLGVFLLREPALSVQIPDFSRVGLRKISITSVKWERDLHFFAKSASPSFELSEYTAEKSTIET